MNEPQQPESDAPSKIAKGIWRGINVLAAIIAIAVLVGAMIAPSLMQGGSGRVHIGWQVAGVAALLGGLYVVTKKNDFSLLILALACAYFFVSCAANFRWMGS